MPSAVPIGRPAPLRQLSCPAALPAPLAAPSRAAELLTAAAAHRTYVEHCLAGDLLQQTGEQYSEQHETGHRLAEMMEGWMTGEDAIEVALWHVETGTRNLAHGKRPTAPARGPGPVHGSIAHRQAVREQESSPRHTKLVAAEERHNWGGCRERWSNHECSVETRKGDSPVFRVQWTPDEDELVKELVRELGTKWSEIVKHLPGRTDNGIKNRFYSNIRRQLRIQQRNETTEAELAEEKGKRKR